MRSRPSRSGRMKSLPTSRRPAAARRPAARRPAAAPAPTPARRGAGRAAGGAAAGGGASTYTVKAGDSVSKIAKELLGDAKAYMAIFNANTDQLSDPDKIKPGQVLKIPQTAKR